MLRSGTHSCWEQKASPEPLAASLLRIYCCRNMASQTQGIQQLLQAEKRAAEKVAEARKRELELPVVREDAGSRVKADKQWRMAASSGEWQHLWQLLVERNGRDVFEEFWALKGHFCLVLGLLCLHPRKGQAAEAGQGRSPS